MLNSLNEETNKSYLQSLLNLSFESDEGFYLRSPFNKVKWTQRICFDSLHTIDEKKSIYFQQPKNRKIEICLERDKVNTNTLKLKDNLT